VEFARKEAITYIFQTVLIPLLVNLRPLVKALVFMVVMSLASPKKKAKANS